MFGLVEIDALGNEVWHLHADDIPEMNVKWLLGLQLLPNGNIAVANWLGHGHETEGVPFFEITPSKEVVWICDCRYITCHPAAFQFLDLDKSTVCYTPTR